MLQQPEKINTDTMGLFLAGELCHLKRLIWLYWWSGKWMGTQLVEETALLASNKDESQK